MGKRRVREAKYKKSKPKKANKAKTTSKTKTTTKKSTKSTKSPSSKRPSETAVVDNDPVTNIESSSKKSKTNDSEILITSKDPKISTKANNGRKSKSTESKDNGDSEKSESKAKGKQTSLFSFQ